MRTVIDTLVISTRAPGLLSISQPVAEWVVETGFHEGLLTMLVQHTSASLTIQENADPDVLVDLQNAVAGLAPQGGRELYHHHAEGPDDMAAHIRTVLSGVNLSIPIQAGRMMLGTWQGIYLWEHRDRGRRREIALHLNGV
ncbi:MAG: secondary thiamine-phosphate synthase enzyme YjbQ [Pseudomonadota bacterium]